MAAYSLGQMVQYHGGTFVPNGFGGGYGLEIAVNQLWSHAQLLENEVLSQQKSIQQLEKDLKDEKEKFTKLERRVRNMELRGK